MAAGRKRAGARCRTAPCVLGGRWRVWTLVVVRSSASVRQPTLTTLACSRSRLGRAGARCSCRRPSAAAGGGRSGPQGERDGSRSLRRQHTDVLSAQPAAVRGPRAQDARVAPLQGLPFSLVTFSWASKRKSPARRDAGRTHHGRESVVAPKRTTERPPTPTSASEPPSAGRTHQGRGSVFVKTLTGKPKPAPPGATRHPRMRP